MKLGVVLGGDLAGLSERARRAEEAGFESVWCAETARSAFVQAAVMAQATSRVTIGTDVALAFPRSPTITAMNARDLAELSGGRFVLGLGAQVKPVIERRFSAQHDHPVARISEHVQVVRAMLDAYGGTRPRHSGRFYTVTMGPFPGAGPAPGRVPIHLAAVNKLMAEAAGRVADGVLGHPMTSPRWIREVIRPAVERGAKEAGRRPEEVEVSTGVILQVAPDREVARREAATQVAFYATTPSYRKILDMHGFSDLYEPIRKAFAGGDLAGMTELALPMVDELAVAGTEDECRERLGAFEGVVDRLLLGGAWVGPGADRQESNQATIVDRFSPAAGDA